MNSGSDLLIRVGAAIVSLILMRDAYAALRGHRLLITKGYSTMILDGWKSRLAGAFLIIVAIAFLSVAWFGL
jgi:hypothetical protein